MADEKLIIDVSVRDELTPALQEADKAVGNFATTAKAGFDKVGDSASKLSGSVSTAGAGFEAAQKKAVSFADAARQKFEALGKAAIGIFAADVAAKVFGFSSALDLVNKSAEGVATSIRDIANEVRGLPTLYGEAAQAAKRFDDVLARAREAQRAGDIRSPLRSPALGVNATIDLGRFYGSAPGALEAAALEADRIRAELAKLETQFESVSKVARLSGELGRIGGESAAQVRALAQSLSAQIDARLDKAVADALKLSAQSRAGAFGLSDSPFGPPAPEAFNVPRDFQFIEPRFSAGSEQLGPPAPEFFDVPSNFQFIPGGSGSSRGSGSTFSAEFNAANARRRAVAGRVAQNRRRDQSQFLPLEFTEAVQQTQQIASFAEQAAQSFDELGNAIRGSIGDQVVLGSFNALSNFFAQAIQGQATLRDLGRSFVQLGAQILAQQAALRVLGFFGFGGAAATPSPTATTAPTPGISILGSGGFSTLGIQGGGQSFAASRGAGIQVSLSVTSLDPRGAADVVLSQMPVIQRALASSISNGSSRALRVAVGNA